MGLWLQIAILGGDKKNGRKSAASGQLRGPSARYEVLAIKVETQRYCSDLRWRKGGVGGEEDDLHPNKTAARGKGTPR